MNDDRGEASLSQRVARAADEHSHRTALVDAPNRDSFFFASPRRLTWAETDAAISSLARQLASLGAGAGSRVAVQLPNAVELPLTLLACWRLGAVAVPFPIQHRAHELRFGIETAEVSLFVTGPRPDRPDQLATVCEVAAGFASARWGPVTVAAFGPRNEAGVAALEVETKPADAPASAKDGAADDLATICWTSGTTGTPKGVPRTNAMWLASGAVQVDALGISGEDRILCPFPVVNMAGIGGMLVPWLMTGSLLALHQPLDLGVFLGQLQSEAITYTVAPPALLNMLLANEEMIEKVDLGALRRIGSGSAPLDPWMVEGWERRGIEIVNVFGSNEGAALLSTRETIADPAERARYFPLPTRPDHRVRVVDLETGEAIGEAGRPGELRIAGPTVFGGYLDSTGEEFDEQGFFRTGDVFELAGDPEAPGLLRFVDRAKDIIIRGGMNVSAAEVEALAAAHPGIAECAAVAYPDRDLGERVGLFAVAAPGQTPTLDELVAHMRAQDVASYKLPERLELLDALPRNPLGKVLKSQLRKRWEVSAEAGAG